MLPQIQYFQITVSPKYLDYKCYQTTTLPFRLQIFKIELLP